MVFEKPLEATPPSSVLCERTGAEVHVAGFDGQQSLFDT
jgi:hypothetical protein